MKDLSGHIKYCIIALACVLTLGSCIFDDYPDDGQSAGGAGDPDKALFVLHVNTLSTTTSQENNDVTEKIKSLRVIAISRENDDDEGTIEINRLVSYGDLVSSNLGYSLIWTTNPGKKDFYIIANEESVGTISFANDAPDAVKSMTKLTDLLNHYKATPDSDKFGLSDDASSSTDNKTNGSDEKSSASEFEQAINAIYFSPTYEIKDDNEGRHIFLPYTTCYKDVEVKSLKETGGKTNQTMYLVPVATKFYFRFYNYHQYPVEIKNLSIKSIASQNFLLANVDEKDQTKDFDGVQMYWVDWLAEVAKKTQDSQLDNSDINDKYGWISAYQLPETNDHKEKILIDASNEKTISVSTDKEENPLYLGPYYLSESRNFEDSNTTQEEQDYMLHLYLHDTESGTSTSNDLNVDLRIENVKALFRDTYVLIKVTMKNGDVEVYSEMVSWEHKEVDGWAEGGSIIP